MTYCLLIKYIFQDTNLGVPAQNNVSWGYACSQET